MIKKKFNVEDRKNKLQVVVNSIDNDDEGSLKIHQDAKLSRLDLSEGKVFDYDMKSKNHGTYIMVVQGEVAINNEVLENRDAIGISETESFKINAKSDCELLFIEVPMLVL